jgi:hypothetical protein
VCGDFFMSTIRDKIRSILSENYKSLIGEMGEKQNRGTLTKRREDAIRKRKEREKTRKPKKQTEKTSNPLIDAEELQRQRRRELVGELKLTPKEALASRLIAYLESSHSKHMLEVFELLEDYPGVKKWARKMSQEALPKNPFNVYAARERIDENIGDSGCRREGNPHNWTLSRHRTKEIWEGCSERYIMECKVTPTDVILYLPAFTKLMERVIFEGLVDEPKVNVLRKAKRQEEIILPERYSSGIIVEVDE